MLMSSSKMKGQYFSFDAIVATVILVLAVTTLATYWFGVHSVVDAKSDYLYSTALRTGDALLSPGVPSGWTDPLIIKPDLSDPSDLAKINQLGLANGYGNDINH